MDFSSLFVYNASYAFSPDSKFIASINQNRLTVRDADSLKQIHVFLAQDNISSFVWSNDSSMVACSIPRKSCVQIWSIIDTTYKLTIAEFAGVQTCYFSPCGNFIFIPCDLNLKVSVWAIDGSYVGHINNPKSATKGYDFSSKGDTMAIAERRNGRDFVHIIDLDSYDDINVFETETEDLADLKFSPDGQYISVWDSHIDYKLCLYRVDGTLVNSYSAYDNLLGIKKVQWSPSSQLIAIGSYDSKLRLLNRINWKILDEFDHTNIKQAITIFKEGEYNYEVVKSYISKPEKFDFEQANPKVGVGFIEWSFDGRYLCSREDSTPNMLFIWDCCILQLQCVLVHSGEIKTAKWCPTENRLAVASGNGKINFWIPEGCSVMPIGESKFAISSLKWSPNGKSLILSDGFNYCCSYPVELVN